MSTTFQVYPQSSDVPSFGDVLAIAEKRLHQRLLKHDVPRLRFTAEVHRADESRVVPAPLSMPMTWGDNEYAWFSIGGVHGGTDAYYCQTDEDEQEYWNSERLSRPRLDASYIRECLEVGHHWSFRRSAGQPAIIHLAYGFIAAALAEHTNGFLDSEDSAWDHQRFEARPEEFYEWYFEPNQALNEKYRSFSQLCMQSIASEFGRSAT